MKMTINTPPDQEVLEDGQIRETKTKTVYEDGEPENAVTEITELERAGYNVEVTINAKIPKE